MARSTSSDKPVKLTAAQKSKKAGTNAIYANTAISASRELKSNDLDAYWMVYQRHPWVGVCVDLIAEAVSAEGYSVMPIEGETRQPVGTDDVRTGKIVSFLRNAFVGSTFTRALLSTAVDLRVYGVSYWRKIRFGRLQVGFERLDPRTVSRKMSDSGTSIATFIVRKLDSGGLITGDIAVIISPEDMTMFTIGGGDPVLGAPSPIERLDLTVATDWQIRRYREAFFRNGAVAGRVLINKDGHEDDVKAALAMVRSTATGAENAFKTAVITGEWSVYEKAASGDNDVDFVKGSVMARDEVFAIFKVPVSKLFPDSKGALGQAGKQADDDTFQRDAVLPVERAIYETITLSWLHAEVGWNDLELIPKRLNQIRFERFDAAETIVKFGGTGNEARAIANLPSLPDPGMNVPLFLGQHQAIVDEEIGGTPAPDPKADPAKPNQPATVNKDKNTPATTTAPSKPKTSTSGLPTTSSGAKTRG